MQFETEILIIGGGLAGLTAALHLHKCGLTVIVIEKNTYPHHKVCGEYISNEVLPYFEWLDIHIGNLCPTSISNLQFTSISGGSITTKLPLGGFGLSRYTMDHFLYTELLKRNVAVIHDTVSAVNFDNDQFIVQTSTGKSFKARQVIGAYGKRSAIDIQFNRQFSRQKSPYLAVKAHYRADFENDLVSLHNFKGGYCGVSKVEDEKLNICYLANYESFKKHKNITAYQENVLYKNKYLSAIFEHAEILFESPITISQISFDAKEPVVDHMLMIGDTAGLIHPLCGNGMAMAIHGAKIASELLSKFFRAEMSTRQQLENNYARLWNNAFMTRLRMGRLLSLLLKSAKLERLAMNSLTKMPCILGEIIERTHGKPILT